MEQLHDAVENFDADAKAAWEAYQLMIWREVEQRKLAPELGRRLCDALGMVAWFHGYQAGRRDPLPLI